MGRVQASESGLGGCVILGRSPDLSEPQCLCEMGLIVPTPRGCGRIEVIYPEPLPRVPFSACTHQAHSCFGCCYYNWGRVSRTRVRNKLWGVVSCDSSTGVPTYFPLEGHRAGLVLPQAPPPRQPPICLLTSCRMASRLASPFSILCRRPRVSLRLSFSARSPRARRLCSSASSRPSLVFSLSSTFIYERAE